MHSSPFTNRFTSSVATCIDRLVPLVLGSSQLFSNIFLTSSCKPCLYQSPPRARNAAARPRNSPDSPSRIRAACRPSLVRASTVGTGVVWFQLVPSLSLMKKFNVVSRAFSDPTGLRCCIVICLGRARPFCTNRRCLRFHRAFAESVFSLCERVLCIDESA